VRKPARVTQRNFYFEDHLVIFCSLYYDQRHYPNLDLTISKTIMVVTTSTCIWKLIADRVVYGSVTDNQSQSHYFESPLGINAPVFITSSIHLGSIASSLKYGELSDPSLRCPIVKPRPRNAHLCCVNRRNLIEKQRFNLRVMFVLVGDVVVFITGLFNNLTEVQRATGKHGIYAACIVVYNTQISTIFSCMRLIELTFVPRSTRSTPDSLLQNLLSMCIEQVCDFLLRCHRADEFVLHLVDYFDSVVCYFTQWAHSRAILYRPLDGVQER
jgi:hypothetical protein